MLQLLWQAVKKSSITPASNSVNASTSSEVRMNKYFLTAHTWMYNKYYIGYVDSSNKGTLAYRRGGKHNTIVRLDNYHFNWYYTDIYGVKRYAEKVPFN